MSARISTDAPRQLLAESGHYQAFAVRINAEFALRRRLSDPIFFNADRIEAKRLVQSGGLTPVRPWSDPGATLV